MADQEQTKTETVETASAPEPITLTEFLEGVSPSQLTTLKGVFTKRYNNHGGAYEELNVPQLQLHCTNEMCNGLRFFRYKEGNRALYGSDNILQTYLTYLCSNCQTVTKRYALWVKYESAEIAQGYKFGELPAYGPPTPARLIRLFGDDREIFLKGRQCENHGLGIGAFTYYRRVVENHKNQILDEIIRVSKKIGAPPDMIAALEGAKEEIAFSKAMAPLKNALPQALLVNGHNPLTLLHSALSVGVHQLSDEQCLQIAHDVRVVLVELAERLGQALKDEAEINTAINRLMNPESKA